MRSYLDELPSYDTVHIELSADDVPEVSFLLEIPQYIHETGKYYGANKRVCAYGNLDNLRVRITSDYISIQGSISKWYLGNNIQPLSLNGTKQAFERLSSILHLPMEKAHVKRLDLAACLVMKYLPSIYYNHLGRAGNTFPQYMDNGIYYNLPNEEQLLFYDKTIESKGHVPDEYKGQHLLRYERRFFKPNILVEQLLDEDYYTLLIREWIKGYDLITKINEITLNLDVIKGTKDFARMGILTLASLFGGILKLEQEIENGRIMGKLTSKQKSDLFKFIEQANDVECGLTKVSSLITELNETMKSIKELLC